MKLIETFNYLTFLLFDRYEIKMDRIRILTLTYDQIRNYPYI